MGKEFEVTSDQASKLVDAVQNNESTSAARMLEDVGSCGWPSLMRQAGALARQRSFDLSSHVSLTGPSEKITIEKTSVVGDKSGIKAAFVNQIATDTDTRCKWK